MTINQIRNKSLSIKFIKYITDNLNSILPGLTILYHVSTDLTVAIGFEYLRHYPMITEPGKIQ